MLLETVVEKVCHFHKKIVASGVCEDPALVAALAIRLMTVLKHLEEWVNWSFDVRVRKLG